MITHNSMENALVREVPTHLFQFQEKIFGFFTIPQLLYDVVAFTFIWYIYNQPIPVALRVVISVIYALAVIFVVHIPIKGHNVTEWAYLRARFFVTPNQTVWRPLMKTAQVGSVPASVQSTWIPLRTLEGEVLGFTQKKATKGKPENPDRFCTVLEVGGINLSLLSEEEQARIFAGYETFLSGLQYPLQTYSSNEIIDVQTYAPILAQEQQISKLSKTPHLQALAKKSLQFQRKKISACMATRHFIIVSATLAEFAVQTMDGKSPSILSVLFTFAWMRKRSERQIEEVLQELNIRTEVVIKGLTGIGLTIKQLHGQQLAQFYASALCPGSLVMPFSQLDHPHPLTYQTPKAA